MAFDTFDTGSLDVFSSAGSAVDIPKGFWKPGTAALYNAYAGKTSLLNFGQGSLNVGMSPDAPFAYTGAPGNVNLHQSSITTYLGDHRVDGRSSVQGSEFRTNVANVHLLGVNAQIVGSKTSVTGKKVNISGANIDIAGANINIGGRNWYVASALWDSKKSFDIPHPSKENHRLRYICLEGPTADVFVRGRSKENVIRLPDYWKNLVDKDTIVVNLTPIGNSASPRIMNISDEVITIFSKEEGIFDYYYVVYGERKDTAKNIAEYEGKSPEDYPGDNREYVINGGKGYF